ncbi:hypothetical protein [Salmonella phage SD-6_S16]|nr:hypothetical protein [Salmonella phage SD-6_S16]
MCWFIIFKRIRFFILSFYLLKVFCLLFYSLSLSFLFLSGSEGVLHCAGG